MVIKKSLLSLLILGSCAFSGFGWGQKGHDVTAAIAERHLTPAAKASVDSILEGKSLVYYANWPDNACHTPEYAYTKTWHYKNIDEGVEYAESPINKDGDIVTALVSQKGVLENPEASIKDKWLALVLTVHFTGDIHQPMHMGRATDRGGNNHKIKYFGGDTNLHSTWDSKVLEAGHKWSYTEWVDNIDRASETQISEILQSADPDVWGAETYEIAKSIYSGTPEGTNVQFDYIADWTPVIERQLLRAGLRLADTLNTIFDPAYTSPAK